MKTKLLVVSSIFLIVISFFVFTIAYSPQNQINTENSVNNYGGSLIVGITGDIDSFNPLFNESSISREVTHLMLLGLADLNEKMEFESELASSWEKSDDHLMLTYNLRKDAFWSDGVQITAEDVKFTFDLLKDSVVASPNKDIVDYVKDVSVKDSFTVIFEFSEAYPTQIFDTAWEILPKHILNKADRKTLRSHPFGRAPISSGPFKLKKWVSQQYIELEPNENYFGKRPFLSQIIFKIVPNNTNLITQLKTGEVDMVIGISPEQVNQIELSDWYCLAQF